MNKALQDEIVSIIDDVNDLTIATLREDGCPQATTVSYVNDGLAIYFLTAKDSQKARNIARDNRVSVTINRDYRSWDEIESLSMTGSAHFVSGPDEQAKAGELLFRKFPQAADYEPDDTEDFTFIRVDPRWVSLLDYRKGFGHTELVELEPEATRP